MKVLITGASGSGTTTLGRAVAAEQGWEDIDTDDFFWLRTIPPYQEERDKAARLSMIVDEQDRYQDSVMSGSVMNWGNALEDSFDLIVFLYLETAIRIQRLRQREKAELGKVDEAFITWASEYDAGPIGGRSLAKHKQWLSERRCPVLKIEGDLTVRQRTDQVIEAIGELMVQSKSRPIR